MHKRTLDPIKTMIFGLRKYDLDRCIALQDSLALAKREQQYRQEKKEHAKNRRKGKHNQQQQHQQHQQPEEHLRNPRSGSPMQSMADAQSATTGSSADAQSHAPPSLQQPLPSIHPGGLLGAANGGLPPGPRVHSPGEHSMEHHGTEGMFKNDDQHMRAMAMGHIPLTVNGYFSYKSKVFLVSTPQRLLQLESSLNGGGFSCQGGCIRSYGLRAF